MSSTTASARFGSEPLDVREIGLVDYTEAWELQRALAADRAENRGRDTLLLLEHPSVYTAGRRTQPEDRPTDGTPVIDVDRGGKITWHGPGQLVGYPVVKLAEPVDVVNYVRRIEEALIAVCTDLGLDCGRVDGRSGVWLPAGLRGGVWLPERKVAAIGVRVQRGVALHGFALNCDALLDRFDDIVPCGITDAGVASLSGELGRTVTVADVIPAVASAVTDALEGTLPVADHDIERVTFETATATAQPAFTTHRFG
ncbi:lipoyl(octanoyl) transferase LipB [Rhodococcus sp. NPDC003318]|uniref:lipoyl(octanoyl) transferase LipB n=1 Tax=Rhodococcus sp. NPDC003318 TaxID=3364503 RepID=UPI0036AE0C5D